MALYGIYGRHEIRDCPLNNAESRKFVAEVAKRDMSSVLPKYCVFRPIRPLIPRSSRPPIPEHAGRGSERSDAGTAHISLQP